MCYVYPVVTAGKLLGILHLIDGVYEMRAGVTPIVGVSSFDSSLDECVIRISHSKDFLQ
jgi:hypothetical protein